MLSRPARVRDKQTHEVIKTITSVLVLARAFQDPADGLFYIESPHLEIISAGTTAEEARAVFDEAIRLTFEDWTAGEVIEQRLLECGFFPHKQAVAGCEVILFTPPEVEVETQHQPLRALPPHYSIQSVAYNVDTRIACTV